jgi:hypothetical protein
MNNDWNDLIQRHIAGITTEEEAQRLAAALKADEALADLYIRHVELEVALEAKAASAEATRELLVAPPSGRSSSWFSWRPLTAAAAGLVIGLFCASVVFAYVAPSLGKVVTLIDESFESGPAPLVTGVPIEAGRWSGDFTEVVGEEQGVQPENGRKMLRFLRADYEGKPNAEASRVADLYRLIDLRPFRQELEGGSAVVQLSAAFNAFVYPRDEDYTARVTLHAFDAASATASTLHTASVRDENCLAAASAGPVRFNRKPKEWRRLTSDLRVPANTDFVLIHLIISPGRETPTKEGFSGHYLDDVRLTLRRSP